MLTKSIAFCAFAAIALVAAPASTQSFAQLHNNSTRGTAPTVTAAGGAVNFDGTTSAGSVYNVVHKKTGVYTITWPSGMWNGFPATTCSPSAIHSAVTVCNVYQSATGKSYTTVIHIYNVANGKLVNNGFTFTAALEYRQ